MSPLYPLKSFLLLLSVSDTNPTQSICYRFYLHVLRAPIRCSFPEKFDSPSLSSLWWSKALNAEVESLEISCILFGRSMVIVITQVFFRQSCYPEFIEATFLSCLEDPILQKPPGLWLSQPSHPSSVMLSDPECRAALQMCRLGLGIPCSLISYSLTSRGSLE